MSNIFVIVTHNMEKMILHRFKELTSEKWRRQLHRNTLNYFWSSKETGSVAILKQSDILTYFSQITAQKMKFSIKDFFDKCDQIRSLRWTVLRKQFTAFSWKKENLSASHINKKRWVDTQLKVVAAESFFHKLTIHCLLIFQ